VATAHCIYNNLWHNDRWFT